MHLLFTAVRLNVPALAAKAAVLLTLLAVGGPCVAEDPRREGDTVVAYTPGPEGRGAHAVATGAWLDNPDENDTRWHYVYEGVHYARTLTKEEEEAASRYMGLDLSGIRDMSQEEMLNQDRKQKPIMRYTDANGNKGTLWCNPGPCTAGSPLKHGWATGVGTFLPLLLVKDVKKTLGEAVNKEIATFSSATNRKIFNITKDALLASAETSDDPKLKSAAAMTTEQIKYNQVAFEESQVAFEERMAPTMDVSCNVGRCGSYESNYLGDKPCITATCRLYRKWEKEKHILTRYNTAEEANLQLLKNGQKPDYTMNTQTYVDANGNKGTLWCNPGPCTLGSALRHGWISGAGTFLPEELVGAVTKILTTDSETSSSAIRSEIFNITLKTIKEAAETSADPKLKSAAAMTTEQIKSKQVANEKSQEDKSGNLVVVEETPVEEAPVEEAPVEEAPVEEAPVEEAPVEEAPVEEDHHHDDGTEAPVDEGTEAPVEEWDDDCLGMEQCNIPIEG